MLLEVTVEFKPRFVLLLAPTYNLPAPPKKEKRKTNQKQISVPYNVVFRISLKGEV